MTKTASSIPPAAENGSATPPRITLPGTRSTPAESFTVPADATTLAGFRRWAASEEFPEFGKIAFVGGRLFLDMSPERIELHASPKLEISRVLGNLAGEDDLGTVFPDGVLVVNRAAGLSNEPDVSFASWATQTEGRLITPPEKGDRSVEVVGTPDMVCEILSDSSVEKDTVILPDAYFRAGIPEYWLIDARGEEIDFKLLVAGKEGYEPAAVDAEGWRRSPVFGREFHLSRDRDRVNRWRYRLQHR